MANKQREEEETSSVAKKGSRKGKDGRREGQGWKDEVEGEKRRSEDERTLYFAAKEESLQIARFLKPDSIRIETIRG